MPRLAALAGIVALVGTMGSSFATEPGPDTYGLHPVERSFPGRLLGFQENGEVLVTANGNGLQYWDVTSGDLRESRDLEVGWSVLSPDGSTLAGLDSRCVPEGGEDCRWIYKVRLVDVASGGIVETDLTTDGGGLAFSPDGATLALRTLAGVYLLDVATGGVRDVLADSTEQIKAGGVAFSPDGSLLATTFWDEERLWNGERGIRIWDLAAGLLQSTISTQWAPWDLAFSPDGEALGSDVGLWDVASGQRLSTFDLGRGGYGAVTFSPDGTTLTTADNYEVALWDRHGRWKTLLLSDLHGGMDVAYSPDGSLLASTAWKAGPPWKQVLVWDLTALPPNRPVRGEVVLVDSLGSPIPDTELRVGQDGFRSWLTRTDSEGRAPLAVYRQGLHEVRARGGRWWRSIPLLPDRPFTLTLEASGGVELGDDDEGYVFGLTYHGLLRAWHLEGLPVHRIEVEVQVLGLPKERESWERYVLRLERAISGKSDPSIWISEIDSTGQVRLPIATTSRATGFYQARVGGVRDRNPIGSWTSIPLNQGRRYHLELPIGRPARVTSLGAMKTAVPGSSGRRLGPNVPNPFNETTQIPYRVSDPGPVRLVIYNAIGQPVRTLVDGFREAGDYQVEWHARGVGSGIYFVRLTAPGSRETGRLVLIQ